MPAPGMPVPMDGRDHGYVPRHTPFISQPDYRIYDLNKRLQQRTEESDNLWWDAFATEFFEDDATLTLCFCLEDGPKRYTIGRTLIPRYFRTVFEGGVTDLYYLLKHPKESFHNTTITLDCEQTTMVTHHGKPMFTKVCTEGRLVVEFTFDDLMRIRSWYFDIRQHRELIPRSVINIQDPTMLEQLSKNITRQGLTNCTLNYLRLCVILEPMQELMSRHKVYNLSPRDCLKATLFQKWQHTNRPQPKRRKRKSSATLPTSGGNNMGMNSIGGGNSKKKSPGSFSSDGMPTRNGPGGRSKKRSRSGTPQPVPIPPWIHDSISEDVMVVGEPSLMGGEFGDEDERLITRLENAQGDTNNGMENDEDFAGGESGGNGPGGPGPGGPKANAANAASGPGGGGGGGQGGPWNSADTKPPPGTNSTQDDKQVTASQN